MELDPLTVVAVLGMASLLIERVFYYKSRYKKRNNKSDNPGNYGERISTLEEAVKNMEKNNDKDHELIRNDISKLFNLLNGLRRPGK